MNRSALDFGPEIKELAKEFDKKVERVGNDETAEIKQSEWRVFSRSRGFVEFGG